MTAIAITPCRGDFYATDNAAALVKVAKNFRRESNQARAECRRIYRVEMRYVAKRAVKFARAYRATRT